MITVTPASARSPEIAALLDALTVELAQSGYTDEQTFGYSLDQLEASGVHLVAARENGAVLGVGGVELQDGGTAELRRFYVRPDHRGGQVADAIIATLIEHSDARGHEVVRLETGDKQHAAIAFYTRHGFVAVPRFPPYTGSTTSVCMELGPPLVPAGFDVPAGLETDRFRLALLGPRHDESDYAAWRGSIGFIRGLPGWAESSWPAPMTRAENLRDLRAHQARSRLRRDFAYTVLRPDRDEVIGCVYLKPVRPARPEAVAVRSWVTAEHPDLDAPLHDAVVGWLAERWPWTELDYAPR